MLGSTEGSKPLCLYTVHLWMDQGGSTFMVSIAQIKLTIFKGDVAAVKQIIDLAGRALCFSGHSYGGSVITIAGNDTKVAGLVYIAAQPLMANLRQLTVKFIRQLINH